MARYQVVPFFQALRASELERIHTWLEHERRFDVLLMTGDAGTGKTRLLYEVIERRREACWVAGLVEARSSFDEQKASLTDALAVPHPLLVALDYAETSPELGKLLEWLQAQSLKREKPLRVLLAARGAGDWWQNLPLILKQPLSSLLKAAPVAVGANPEESTLDALTELHRESLQRFADALQVPVPEPLPVEPLPYESLDRRPLFVLLTALAQTLGLPTKRETLLEALIHHERQFWRTLLPEHAYEHDAVLADTHRLVAAMTLRGGVRSEPELKSLFERLSTVTELTLTRAMSFMRRVYPATGLLWVRPVEPDLLGAELVRQVLIKSDPGTLLEPALADNAPGALAIAFRLLEDIGQEDEALSRRSLEALLSHDIEARALPALQAATRWRGDRPMHVIAEELLARLKQGVSTEFLGQIHNALPQRSLALAELALWVTDELLSTLSTLDEEGRALLLLNKCERLRHLELRTEALKLGQDVVSLYQNLALVSPEKFKPQLAESLNLQGILLDATNAKQEAVVMARKAAAIFGELSEQFPASFDEGLARCLSNMAAFLNGLGRREDSLLAAREAVTVYRRLAERSPSIFTHGLAQGLGNLSSCLMSLGMREDSLAAAQEGVVLLRTLAEQVPDAYEADLAKSLGILGNILSEQGQGEDALATNLEAVNTRRKLAERWPEKFNADLALSLNNLGNCFSALGRREEALLTTREAVCVYRKLAEQLPDAFAPTLAVSLNNLGGMLHNLGLVSEALAAQREAVEILTPYVKMLPIVHGRYWFILARNLRNRLQEVGISPTSDPQLMQYMALLAQLESRLPKP